MLKEIGKRAGVESVHPHRFRRTFASKLAERGMKVQDIQKLMGHSNIETTMEYVYTSDQMVSAAYQQYIA
jgi:integrase